MESEKRVNVQTDRFLRIEQAARLLGVSKSWIYQRRERLPFLVRLPGGALRVSVLKLREWMKSLDDSNGDGHHEESEPPEEVGPRPPARTGRSGERGEP